MSTTLDLALTTMSYGPDAIGRHSGQAVFVPLAIPGEQVRAEVVEERKTFLRARLGEVLTPSPDRSLPPCPHFGTCGGCHWQHLAYPAQLRWKSAVVADQLTRIGGFANPPVREALPSPSALGYRNNVQLALTPDGKPGFYALHSDNVIPIHECHIIRPQLAELFTALELGPVPGLERVSLRVGADDSLLILEMGSDELPEIELDLPVSVVALFPDGSTRVLAGNDYLIERVHGRPFRVSAGSFFQVNTPMAEKLIEFVLDYLDLQGDERLLEVYCGVGLLTAFLAPRAARITGVESYSPAVRDAEVNLDEFDNVEIYEAPAEAVLPHLAGPYSAAVLDPPRTGCAPSAVDALAALGPRRIVYVSCDPPSLARDGRRLAAGGYRLEIVQPVDMFPQTYHIETVSLWAL